MNGIEIIKIFETIYPMDLAYNWDNVGLQIGSINKDVKNVLLTLDLTLEVVEEAIENNRELRELLLDEYNTLIREGREGKEGKGNAWSRNARKGREGMIRGKGGEGK